MRNIYIIDVLLGTFLFIIVLYLHIMSSLVNLSLDQS